MKRKIMLEIMGQIVTVTHRFERKRIYPESAMFRNSRCNKEWHIVNVKDQRAGWIVGFRTLQNGVYTPGNGDIDDWEPAYLDVTSTVPCILVSYWPTMNPVKVPEIGFYMGGAPMPPDFPWSEHDREDLRQIMKEMPRDKKGRWIG